MAARQFKSQGEEDMNNRIDRRTVLTGAAAAIRVISQYVTDRDQRLEMLEMLGLLPAAIERVA